MVGRRERADPCECAYVVAHNLLRWTQLIGPPDTTVRAARTLRRRLITIAGRLTRHGRSWTLYLPAHWPWHGDRAEHRPGAVGVELPGGGMRQRFLSIGDHLFDDGVVAMLGLDDGDVFGAVGDKREATPVGHSCASSS